MHEATHIENIEVVYTLANGQKVHAAIGGDGWEQWGAPRDLLTQTTPMTETLHRAALEVAEENGDELDPEGDDEQVPEKLLCQNGEFYLAR